LVTFGSAIIVMLSVAGAIITARYFPSAHSVDLKPLGPILLGIDALLVLWVGAFGSWIIKTLRKTPSGGAGSARSSG